MYIERKREEAILTADMSDIYYPSFDSVVPVSYYICLQKYT